MDPELREELKQSLQHSLRHYVERFKYGASTQPLDLLIPTERKIRSIVGGLETSMGTTAWEPIAKKLAARNGFEVLDEKILKPAPMPVELATALAAFISLRETPASWIPAIECVQKLRSIVAATDRSSVQYIPPPTGTGVDIFLKKDSKYYAFDIKTVQPNIGSVKSFNKELLEWYAYSICKDPAIDIHCMIAYPYNPYRTDFWTHAPHSQAVLEPRVDALVENEFWDFISGIKDTYQYILGILSELKSEGFGEELSTLIKAVHTP